MIDITNVMQVFSPTIPWPRSALRGNHSWHERGIHFLDIENLCGTADISRCTAALAIRSYCSSVPIAAGDHVVIGSSHHNLLNAGVEWPGVRLLPPRSGPDGADAAIREALRTERITERFNTVFLGSGDGGFAPDAAWLASRGTRIHVVSRVGALSPKLRLAAHDVTLLFDSPFNKDNIA